MAKEKRTKAGNSNRVNKTEPEYPVLYGGEWLTKEYMSASEVPWHNEREFIDRIVFEGTVEPRAAAYWFDQIDLTKSEPPIASNIHDVLEALNFKTINATSVASMFRDAFGNLVRNYRTDPTAELDISSWEPTNYNAKLSWTLNKGLLEGCWDIKDLYVPFKYDEATALLPGPELYVTGAPWGALKTNVYYPWGEVDPPEIPEAQQLIEPDDNIDYFEVEYSFNEDLNRVEAIVQRQEDPETGEMEIMPMTQPVQGFRGNWYRIYAKEGYILVHDVIDPETGEQLYLIASVIDTPNPNLWYTDSGGSGEIAIEVQGSCNHQYDKKPDEYKVLSSVTVKPIKFDPVANEYGTGYVCDISDTQGEGVGIPYSAVPRVPMFEAQQFLKPKSGVWLNPIQYQQTGHEVEVLDELAE